MLVRKHDKPLICPSVLAADFAHLADSIGRVNSEADWLHCDIMDGSFVPNISFGLPVIAALRQITDLPLDVHLMVESPERWVDSIAKLGADSFVFHQEAVVHGHRLIQSIKAAGMSAGVALCPSTPLNNIEEYLNDIDLLLIMTVNPGFGGQSYIESMTDKIRRARQLIDASGRDIFLQVDGGISRETIAVSAEAGADVFVAGSACFGRPDPVAEIIAMRDRAEMNQ